VVTVDFQVRIDPNLRQARMIVNQAEVTAVEIEGSISSDDPDNPGPTETPIGDPELQIDPIQPDANPVTGDEVVIGYTADGAPARLSIFNLVGERIRAFGGLPATGQVVWRLDNESGRSVANSTYIIVLESPISVNRDKLVVTR
jgi:hypothetical protein